MGSSMLEIGRGIWGRTIHRDICRGERGMSATLILVGWPDGQRGPYVIRSVRLSV